METPNKVDLIQTVVACELKESCYRVPYVEYYYEIVHHADGVKEERLKVSHYNTLLFLTLIHIHPQHTLLQISIRIQLFKIKLIFFFFF